MIRVVLLLAAIGASASANLDAVKTEPNLEKRSERALLNADVALNEARQAWQAGNLDVYRKGVEETLQSVELSYKSLQDTGKRARRSPKFFKRAELTIRKLIKRLDAFEKEVGIEDREPVQMALKRVHEIHDQLVTDIMTKK